MKCFKYSLLLSALTVCPYESYGAAESAVQSSAELILGQDLPTIPTPSNLEKYNQAVEGGDNTPFLHQFFRGAISFNFREKYDCSKVLQSQDLDPSTMSDYAMHVIPRVLDPLPAWYVEEVKARAEKNNFIAHGVLGFLYSDGKGVEKDVVMEISSYRKAIKGNVGVAYNNLDVLLDNNSEIAREEGETKEELKEKTRSSGFVGFWKDRPDGFLLSAAAGRSECILDIGLQLLEEKRYAEALPYLQDAYDQGEECQSYLGVAECAMALEYEKKGDQENATRFFEKGMKHVAHDEKMTLGFLYANNAYPQRTWETVKTWLEESSFKDLVEDHKNAFTLLEYVRKATCYSSFDAVRQILGYKEKTSVSEKEVKKFREAFDVFKYRSEDEDKSSEEKKKTESLTVLADTLKAGGEKEQYLYALFVITGVLPGTAGSAYTILKKSPLPEAKRVFGEWTKRHAFSPKCQEEADRLLKDFPLSIPVVASAAQLALPEKAEAYLYDAEKLLAKPESYKKREEYKLSIKYLMPYKDNSKVYQVICDLMNRLEKKDRRPFKEQLGDWRDSLARLGEKEGLIETFQRAVHQQIDLPWNDKIREWSKGAAHLTVHPSSTTADEFETLRAYSQFAAQTYLDEQKRDLDLAQMFAEQYNTFLVFSTENKASALSESASDSSHSDF
jgi:TPR repeat protein